MPPEIGTIVVGKVTKVTEFGAFVELETGETGLIHISEVDRSFVRSVSDFLREEDVVNVKVLDIKPDGKIDLSIKQTQPAEPRQRARYSEDFERMLKDYRKSSEERLADLRRYNKTKRP